MPKISAQASRQRRDNIMDAARRCFVRSGIHISVDDICAEAGVSKGALYGYFPSKESIIQAIADEHVSDLARVRKSKSADELIAALLERLGNGRTSARLELEAWAYSLKNEKLRNRLFENAAELRLSIKEALESIGVSNDSGQKLSIGDSALLIETIAMGLVARAALGEDAEAERALSLVISAIVGD
jgi:TetR/AcrR family transcriptional regulator, repressor for uid operon